MATEPCFAHSVHMWVEIWLVLCPLTFKLHIPSNEPDLSRAVNEFLPFLCCSALDPESHCKASWHSVSQTLAV